MSESLQKVFDGIDDANALDPNTEVWQGEEHPKELLYGRRMTEWLDRLYPDASEPLRIAARGQHIRRWEIPRSDYPDGRAGYHRWRTFLYGYHADKTSEIMRDAGYGDEAIDRVRVLLSKRRLRTDADTQALEDAACLVFLENYFQEFIDTGGHSDEKVIDIVRKTWAKMSARAHEAALKLELPDRAAELVHAALKEDA